MAFQFGQNNPEVEDYIEPESNYVLQVAKGYGAVTFQGLVASGCSEVLAWDLDFDVGNSDITRNLNAGGSVFFINLRNSSNYTLNDFYVNSKVLDPRPETELLIEKVLDLFPNKNQKLNILDMCTGSGCIAISLAREYLNSKIYATDLSLDAINVAKFNAERLNCLDQIKFVNCDLLDHYDKYDIIASNPPYLSETEYTKTSKEIRLYEPKIAFTSSQNGYNFYYRISKILPRIMHKKSLVFLEIGSSQAKKTKDIFKLSNIHLVKKIKDIQSFDRLLILNKP